MGCSAVLNQGRVPMLLKRLIDVTVSALGLLALSPLMLIIAAAIKLESRGPILYGCKRVGKSGQLFNMLKFRTMLDNADNVDCKLCGERDVRVTPFGRLLRRSKLNEFPQLINVLRGEMSLVGPRPEDPKFVKYHADKWAVVLTCKPGIVGPNQIFHRNEEDLLECSADPEKYYVEELLPKKLKVDLEYAQNIDIRRDFALLVRGVYVTIFGSDRVSGFFKNRELLVLILKDVALSIIGYCLAYSFRFETLILHHIALQNLAILSVLSPLVFIGTGIYRIPARFFSLSDLIPITKAAVLCGALLVIGNKLVLSDTKHSRTIFILYPIILLCLMAGIRAVRRMIHERRELLSGKETYTINALIYGAGRLGVETAERLKFEPGIKVRGFIDDNPCLRNQTILGFKVLGTGDDLAALKLLYGIDKIFVAFKAPKSDDLYRVRNCCVQAGLSEIVIRSSVPSSTAAPFLVSHSFRKTRTSDLLGMREVVLDLEKVQPIVEGAVFVLDRAGNLMGEHLCRELLNMNPRELILLESCSEKLDSINRMVMSYRHHNTQVFSYLVPGGSPDLLESALKRHKIDFFIINLFGKSVSNSISNRSGLFLNIFVETVRRVESAKRIQCMGVSLLSPFSKSSLSMEERAMCLLSEHYVASGGVISPSCPRMGIFRLPNLLEIDCPRSDHMTKINTTHSATHVRFTSVRYAARLVLNSLPMHNYGETFIETISQSFDQKSLSEIYTELLLKGANPSLTAKINSLKNYLNPPNQQNTVDVGSQQFSGDLLALENHEVPDIDGLRSLTRDNQLYLTALDKMLAQEFASLLEDKYASVSTPAAANFSTSAA